MRIAIIGAGYVGLVSGACLADKGNQVICVDKKPEIVAAINNGQSPLYEPGLEEIITRTVAAGKLRASTSLTQAIQGAQLSIIAVGTPMGGDGIDLSYIQEAAREIGKSLRQRKNYHLVCVKSTVVPGTTDTIVRSILEEESGKVAGEFGLAMNPEFLREGNAVEDFLYPDRIIIGAYDERSFQVMNEVYAGFAAPILQVSLRTAEMGKYTTNALLASLVSFANEIAGICEAARDIDVKDVMETVTLDKRLNPRIGGNLVNPGILAYLQAGCGFGGSCFPKDVKALIAYAGERGREPYLLSAAMAVNAHQPLHMVRRLEEAMAGLEGKKVAVFGLAFKPGTDDVRETPALPIIRGLLARGARVIAVDPVAVERMEAVLPRVWGRLEYTRDRVAALKNARGAVLVTPWPEFLAILPQEYVDLMASALVMDCRRVLNKVELEAAGCRYLGTGLAEEVGKDV